MRRTTKSFGGWQPGSLGQPFTVFFILLSSLVSLTAAVSSSSLLSSHDSGGAVSIGGLYSGDLEQDASSSSSVLSKDGPPSGAGLINGLSFQSEMTSSSTAGSDGGGNPAVGSRGGATSIRSSSSSSSSVVAVASIPVAPPLDLESSSKQRSSSSEADEQSDSSMVSRQPVTVVPNTPGSTNDTLGSSSSSSIHQHESNEGDDDEGKGGLVGTLKHLLPVDVSALVSLGAVAALLTLSSAIVNPALCAQTARIYLILQLSECNFASLEDIQVFSYPLQFTVGGDPAAKFFTSLIFVWPMAGFIVLVHYVIVRIAARGGDDHHHHRRLENTKRKYHFPSLSITATVVFFCQPMAMSATTVLSKGRDDWMRYACFLGLLASFAIFCGVARWYYRQRGNIEFLEADQYYDRLLEDASAAARETKKGEKRQQEEKQKAKEEAAEKKMSLVELRKKLREKKKKEIELRKETAKKKSRGELDDEDEPSLEVHEVYIPLSSTEATRQGTLFEKMFTAPGKWVDRKRYEEEQEDEEEDEERNTTARITIDGGASSQPLPFEPYVTPGFVDKHGYMFIKYRPGRQWFLGVEVIISFLLGIVEGVRPDTPRGCWLLSVVQFSVLLLNMIISLIANPYLTLFDTIGFALLSLSQALVVLLLMLDVQDFLDNPADFLAGGKGGDTAGNVGDVAGADRNSSSSSTATLGSGGNSLGSGENIQILESTGIRQAADYIAFALFAFVVMKAMIDIGMMIYFWRRHQTASSKEEEESSSSQESTTESDKDARGTVIKVQKKRRAKNDVSKKTKDETDLTSSDPEDKPTSPPRQRKGKKKEKEDEDENPLVKALLSEIPERDELIGSSLSTQPKRAERGRKGETGENPLLSNPLRSRSKKKKNKIINDDGGEVEMKEAPTSPSKKSKRGKK